MATDAGDFAINDAPAAQSKASTSAYAQLKGPASRGPSFDAPAKLEPFLLLAKSASGAAAAGLVAQATAAPGVFCFSELLAAPNVSKLAESETHRQAFALLELFAHGTWRDYLDRKDSLPALNKAQETKLRQLTILTLAIDSRVLGYERLLRELSLESVPELEDLLIDGTYAGVFSARLDQRLSRLELVSGIGRDVRPSSDAPPPGDDEELALGGDMDVDTTATDAAANGGSTARSRGAHTAAELEIALTRWHGTITNVLSSLDSHAQALADKQAKDAKKQKQQAARILKLAREAHANPKSGSGGGGGKRGKQSSSRATPSAAIESSMFADAKEDQDMDFESSAPRTRKRGRP